MQFCEELFTEPSDCKWQEIKELSGRKIAQCSHVVLASICFAWVSEDRDCCLRFGQLFAQEASLFPQIYLWAEIIQSVKINTRQRVILPLSGVSPVIVLENITAVFISLISARKEEGRRDKNMNQDPLLRMVLLYKKCLYTDTFGCSAVRNCRPLSASSRNCNSDLLSLRWGMWGKRNYFRQNQPNFSAWIQ